MASEKERNDSHKQAKELLTELASVDPAGLSRTEELSRDINFSEAVPSFERMLEIVSQLNERDIARLSTKHLKSIIEGCKKLQEIIQQVSAFKLNQNNPADVCKGIIDTIKGTYDLVMEPLTLPLAFTATQATDYARIEREAKGCHVTIKEEADKFTKFMEEAKAEAQKALQAVRDQAAEAGVSTNAQIFLQDSQSHSRTAFIWLVATIGASFITLLVAVFFVKLSLEIEPKSVPAAIQYTVSKLILLSTLSFGIFWCAKNYKSQKHNETLNKHRANALMTFRSFVEGTDDQGIKDAILLQAAQAAFSSRPTGFDSVEGDGHLVNPVIEVLGKTATKSQTSG